MANCHRGEKVNKIQQNNNSRFTRYSYGSTTCTSIRTLFGCYPGNEITHVSGTLLDFDGEPGTTNEGRVRI